MYDSAITQLEVNLATALTNAPVWEAEGNLEQSAVSREHAESYRAAIAKLREDTDV